MLDPNFQQDVIDFHTASGDLVSHEPRLLEGEIPFDEVIPALKALDVKLQLPSKSQGQLALRLRLIIEELTETLEAMRDGDLVEAFDGVVDLLYVVVGMGVAMGLPLNLGWEEVHRTNMAKVRGPDGAIVINGKIQKPEGWESPTKRLAELVDRYTPVHTSGYVQVVDTELEDGTVIEVLPPESEVDTAFVEAEPPPAPPSTGLYGWRK